MRRISWLLLITDSITSFVHIYAVFVLVSNHSYISNRVLFWKTNSNILLFDIKRLFKKLCNDITFIAVRFICAENATAIDKNNILYDNNPSLNIYTGTCLYKLW